MGELLQAYTRSLSQAGNLASWACKILNSAKSSFLLIGCDGIQNSRPLLKRNVGFQRENSLIK